MSLWEVVWNLGWRGKSRVLYGKKGPYDQGMFAFVGRGLERFVPGVRWHVDGFRPKFLLSLVAVTYIVVVGQLLILEYPWLCVPFWYSVVAVYLCLFVSAGVDPGLSVDALQQPEDASSTAFCVYCEEMKPRRTHHCRRCQRCVPIMDHHCVFLQNCVGMNNRRHFVLLLYHASFASCLVLICSPLKVFK